MDFCACGRPLFDGMHQCDACSQETTKRRRHYRDRVKFAQDHVSGYERTNIRNRLARQGRGYDV